MNVTHCQTYKSVHKQVTKIIIYLLLGLPTYDFWFRILHNSFYPFEFISLSLRILKTCRSYVYNVQVILIVPDLPSKEDTIKHLRVTFVKNYPRQVKLTISNDLFTNHNGMILYYSIIIFEDDGKTPDVPKQGVKQSKEKWPPEMFKWTDMISSHSANYYQTSPYKWMPFKS